MVVRIGFGRNLTGFGNAGSDLMRRRFVFERFKNVKGVMVTCQRFLQRLAVGGGFAFKIINFGYFFLNLCPEQRLAVLGNDFLLIAISVDGQPADIGALGQMGKVMKKITEVALNMTPKTRELRLSEYPFAFAKLVNRIAQSLQVFGLFPVIVIKAGKLITNITVVVRISIFAEIFLGLMIMADGGTKISPGMTGHINRRAVVELSEMKVNAAEMGGLQNLFLIFEGGFKQIADGLKVVNAAVVGGSTHIDQAELVEQVRHIVKTERFHRIDLRNAADDFFEKIFFIDFRFGRYSRGRFH